MLKTYLTSDEIRRMIEVAPTLRDQVIVSFLADTGCRVSELLRLKTQHIDFDRRLVLIPHLKVGLRKKCPSCDKSVGRRHNFCPKCGRDISNVEVEGSEERTRLVNVGEETLSLCREYLQKRSGSYDELISLTRQMVYHIMRKCAEAIGLGGRVMLNPETGRQHYVHPHNMRDSLAVDWLTLDDSATSQKALQGHLGHKKYETTARYQKLSIESVADTADKVRRHRFGKGD
ncbi:MAG: site-specific integrase [Bacillota bacterium]|nr:site-specific integrase [Bacillota bacterium]